MPRLLVFLPAQTVIFERENSSMAIIGPMAGLNVPVAGDLPDNTGIPLNWVVLSIWKRVPGEGDRPYEQRVQVIAPSGRIHAEGVSRFRIEENKTHRVRMNIQGFPVTEPGEYTVALDVREVGQGEWNRAFDYPLLVTHTPPKQPQNSESPAVK